MIWPWSMTTTRSASEIMLTRCVIMKRGAVARECSQHFEDELLAFDIDLAGGFVEQQDFGVAQDRTGQGDALPLAAGEAAAAGADERLVAVGQLFGDERVGVGLAGGGFDFVLASRRARRSAMLLATVSLNSRISCDTRPNRERRSRSRTSRISTPSIVMRPASGS